MENDADPEVLAARLLARRERGAADSPDPATGIDAFTPCCNPGGAAPPVFAIPGLFAAGFGWVKFGRTLPADRPLFVLQPPGFDWWAHGLRTLDGMAEHLAARIQACRPSGPYGLIGTSTGGYLAHLTACLLQARGVAVGGLMLMDTELYDDPAQLADGSVERSPEELARNPVERQGQRAGRALVRAIREFRPGRGFEGTIDLVWSSDPGRPRHRDRRLGWARLASRGLRVHPVPQTHDHLVVEENFPLLAGVVAGWLPGAPGPGGLAVPALDAIVPPLGLARRFLGGAWLVGPGREPCRVLAPGRRMGGIDRVERRAGGIVVSGWARDPDRVAPAREVLVFLGDRYAGRAFPAGARPDVVQVTGQPALLGSGFHAFIEVHPGEGEARTPVRVVARGGLGLRELRRGAGVAW